jgi:hypothetical protein
MTMRAALIVYQDTEKGIGPSFRAKKSGVRLGAREKQKAVSSRQQVVGTRERAIQSLKSKIALAPSPVSFTGYHASGLDPGIGR